MKRFILLGFLFFSIMTPSSADERKDDIVEFLLNKNSVVTADIVQKKIEENFPNQIPYLLNVETFFNSFIIDETPLELIARRLQNEEEIILFIENTMRYIYQRNGEKRSLQSLFKFIYRDGAFASKYGSKEDYPKINLLLSKLKEFANTESISKSELEKLSNMEIWPSWISAGIAVGFIIGIITGEISFSADLIFPVLKNGVAGLGLGVVGGGITKIFLGKKKKQLTNQIEMCRQSVIKTSQ